MTIREFMTAVSAMENVSAEIKEFAENELIKLDARNAKRAEKPSKTAIANEPIKAEILRVIGESEEPMTASKIAEVMVEYKVQKISALCTQLLKEEKLVVTDVKVKGKGTQKGYSVAQAE
jgi:hypothetical protein